MVQGSQKRWDCMGLSQMLGRTWTKSGPPLLLIKAFFSLWGRRTGGGGVVGAEYGCQDSHS